MLQILLAWTGSGAPYVAGGLHPLNAFIILGFLGSITYREWKGRAATRRGRAGDRDTGRLATRDRCALTCRPGRASSRLRT